MPAQSAFWIVLPLDLLQLGVVLAEDLKSMPWLNQHFAERDRRRFWRDEIKNKERMQHTASTLLKLSMKFGT